MSGYPNIVEKAENFSHEALLPPAFGKKSFKTSALLTPILDLLMIGGASLIIFAVAYLFVDSTGKTDKIAWAAFYLAFIVNNPHFIASYALLYWDKRRELLTKPRFFWAAVIVPVLLIGYMAACIYSDSPKYLSYTVNLLYFTVGWHYIKQIYGTIIVSCARRGYYFSKTESAALRYSLYPVWMMSFINGNTGIREIQYYGIGYKTFGLPPELLTVDYVLAVLSLFVLGFVVLRKWRRDQKLPAPSGIASFAAIYIWYLPTLYHPFFFFLVPFFHSLQYLLFVTALKKNEFVKESRQDGAELFWKIFRYSSIIFVTSLLTFKLVPEWLDASVSYDKREFGPQLFTFLFLTFINIHHYFIDNVIWRRDNPALKEYLLS